MYTSYNNLILLVVNNFWYSISHNEKRFKMEEYKRCMFTYFEAHISNDLKTWKWNIIVYLYFMRKLIFKILILCTIELGNCEVHKLGSERF